MSAQYTLDVPDDKRRILATGWLWLGILALLGSGIFSVLLVLSRTPYISNLIPWIDFFHTALVVHVDLSVLVWFLAFAGVIWSINSTARLMPLGWLALYVAACGTVIMTVAPFTGDSYPLMSNYIPVLQTNIFITGLLMFAAGIFLLVWRSMTAIPMVGEMMSASAALRFGVNTSTVSVIMAAVAFAWSYIVIQPGLSGMAYYELLFWGGGHVLQFTYTILMLIAWLWLASESDISLPVTPRVVLVFFAFALFAVFFTPLIYYSYPVNSAEHIKLFTWLMRYGGSLATLPLSIAILYGLVKCRTYRVDAGPSRAALLSSMFLFGFGGIIGFLIEGSNVTIPAHYHGSIVGVTLALMGLTYILLPRLGFRPVRTGLARIQPYLYGGGQFLHVSGLLWSGGYGVQRKVAGAEQGLKGLEQMAAMGLMGLGGLISITGGLVFVWLVLEVLFKKKTGSS